MKRQLATTAALANAQLYAVEHQLLSTDEWPRRPDESILNRTIPLFFVARDKDGFWIARNADIAFGGKFFFKYSALRFTEYHNGSAIIMLTGLYSLDTRNTGNRYARQLRPIRRLFRHVASKFDALARLRTARPVQPRRSTMPISRDPTTCSASQRLGEVAGQGARENHMGYFRLTSLLRERVRLFVFNYYRSQRNLG